MTLQQGEKFYADLFSEECCPQEKSSSLKDIEESISECEGMLEYSIQQANKSEVSFWRKMLQRAKVERREILST